LDINSRIAGIFREKDIEIRRILSDKLVRGKIDFILYVESLGDESNNKINSAVVKSYYNQLSEISNELSLPVNDRIMQIIIGLPDAVKTERDELDESEWETILQNIYAALEGVDRFRIQEGEFLHQDIIQNIHFITDLLDQVEPFEKERVTKVKERIYEGLKELSVTDQVNENRLEQEMIFYLEKMDVNEEKVRLRNHCTYFLETLKLNEPVGKKLGFIAQEIGREVNTLGSKANHSEMQKLVIQMKDALERIKEQLLNIL
jgi:uncharacterized protein (TIGR00255 family)